MPRKTHKNPPSTTDTNLDNVENESETVQDDNVGSSNVDVNNDDDLEHAKYMAEFHARPMELDRRSGARTVIRVSKASSHLFQNDAATNDWKSLSLLHPRLIQSLETKFGLMQPTNIQSRTIATILQPQPRKSGTDSDANVKNVLVQAETGSGKTLAYLLPILQQMGFGNSNNSNNNHTTATKPSLPTRKELGTKCIIICPTRELASQTLTVVDKLCQANFAGRMVAGGLLGGDSRSSEKSRLRKGLTILVATPGRLLDHLTKTESLLLNLKGKLDWFVLDEADRLLDMGLGDQIRQIVQLIRANEATKQNSTNSHKWWRSVLVSATVTPSVQSLAKERMLCGKRDWIWVKGGNDDSEKSKDPSSDNLDNKQKKETDSKMTVAEGYSDSTPRQLAHFYVTVTAKLRLTTLISFLTQRVSKGERTVVFMGTCACVDYHYKLFQAMESIWDSPNDKVMNTKDNDDKKAQSGLFGNKANIFKLHGSVQHSQRNQTLKQFDNADGATILLTTDVSARGLNLEGVDWTVQYDPPFEIADYIHRAGRVARAGKAGHSLLFLLPSERGYLDVLQTKGISSLVPISLATTLNQAASLCPTWTNAGLKHGGKKEQNQLQDDTNTRKHGNQQNQQRLGEHFIAEVQRRLEDCILQDDATARQKWKEHQQQQRANGKKRKKDSSNSNNKRKEGELLELARDAFMSFLRAYPTKKEPSVRSIFSARALHLGHVARSFALKEPPKSLVSKHKQNQKGIAEQDAADQEANKPKALQFSSNDMYENNLVSISDNDDDDDDNDINTNNHHEVQVSRPTKKQRRQKNNNQGTKQQPGDSGRIKNARTLLLANAMKLQNNLMDAM